MYRMTLVFVLLLTSIVNAQEAPGTGGTVKGIVYTLTDSTEQNPFEGWTKGKLVSANIALLNPADSSVITGDGTNLKGHYIISDVKPGDYILKVSYIGFKTHNRRISISPGDTLTKNIQLNIVKNLHNHSIAKTNFLKINEQGVIVYQPVGDYLVEVSQEWGAKRSELGNLRTKTLKNDDIELRFWDGYGLFGTRGVLLKKKDGNWSASKLTVESCSVYYSDSLKGKTSKKEFFSDLTTNDCNEKDFEFGSLRSIDTVMVKKFERNGLKLDELWNKLLEAELLDLPTHIESNLVTSDGRHFVVEVRIGNLYRASTLTYHKENHEYVIEPHEKIKKLAKILYKNLDLYD